MENFRRKAGTHNVTSPHKGEAVRRRIETFVRNVRFTYVMLLASLYVCIGRVYLCACVQ